MVRREFGGMLRGLGVLLGGAIVVGLLACVTYLLGDINQRRFRFRQQGAAVVVERGRFFPVGFVGYVGNTDALARAYAPIAVPPHEAVDISPVFDERTALDQALFAVLAAWAKAELEASDPSLIAMAGEYVRRAELLPGIAEAQRQQLRALRADALFRQAEGMVDGVVAQLMAAREALQQAIDLGTTHAAAARQVQGAVQQKIQLLNGAQRDDAGEHQGNPTLALPPPTFGLPTAPESKPPHTQAPQLVPF